jgi:TIR domain/Pentapeptide repeats (8 copies)
MANPEHVAKLREGVETWNAWREQNPSVHPELSGLEFCDANLSGVNLRRAILVRAYMPSAYLNGADLSGAVVSDSDLQGANLISAQMTDIDATGVDFREANFRSADLSGARLRRCNLARVDLTDATLLYADITDADLHGTRFARASIGWTTFGNNDLSKARDLDRARHQGPSSVGVDTLIRSRAAIPFLRGCGVPEYFITQAHSFVGQAIQFHSCFISYSSHDQLFADRLHADLQAAGVRCWFAPHDMRIGDRIRARIEESIRLYDKLLVILSVRALASDWVEDEVEAAYEKEKGPPQKTVLSPVRLDDSVLEANAPWATKLRRSRHIGDFRSWKDHDAYTESFDRLLRDLRQG